MSFVRSKIVLVLSAILLFTPTVSYAEEKTVALTFDDGPHYKYTEEILDILKKHSVKATFFCAGYNTERFPEIVEREHREGHEVANHTYSHRHMHELTEAELEEEILKCEELIGETEEGEKLFRPPEGILSEGHKLVLDRLGYHAVLWDVDTKDWAHASVDSIVNNVLKNVKDGSVILFHDFIGGDSPTPEAIEVIIPRLKEMGYRFVLVSEINKETE